MIGLARSNTPIIPSPCIVGYLNAHERLNITIKQSAETWHKYE